MKNIKQKILLASLVSAGLATVMAMVNTHGLTNESSVSALKVFSYAGYLGLFSVSSFFVGIAYPKDTIESNILDSARSSRIGE